MHRILRVFAAGIALSSPAAAQTGAARADSLFAARDFEHAIGAYEALTRVDSTVPRYWFQLGMAAANLSKYDRAAVAFARASALGPNPNAFYNAAAMHARMNHADSAFDWLHRAVQKGFANTALLQNDDDLASLRSDARFPAVIAAIAKAMQPCMSDPEYRRFDFWVGEWDVTTQGGTRVGGSVVQSVSNGCALLENWTAGNGGTGKSLNTFNPQTKQWTQFWVGSAGGVTHYTESEWHDGAVTFHASAGASGVPAQRLTFTPIDSKTVRQFGEVSKDGGKTWTVGYDFYYHRR